MHYHPGKANVVADALSRKKYATLAFLVVHSHEIIPDLHGILQTRRQEFRQIRLFSLVALPALLSRVKESWFGDEEAEGICARLVEDQELPGWSLDQDGYLLRKGKVYVPAACREEVLREHYTSRFVVHPGSTKMYSDLKRQY